MDIIWKIDTNGSYTYVAGNVEKILGYTAEEMHGKTLYDFMPDEDAIHAKFIFKKIIEKKEPIIDRENVRTKKNGDKIYLLTNGIPVFNEKRELIGYSGIDKDITVAKKTKDEKERVEKEIEQSRKLEAIGTLAAGIAHEINTPMQFIGDNVRFIQEITQKFFALIENYKELFQQCTKGKETDSALLQVTQENEKIDLEYLKEELPIALEQTSEGIVRVNQIIAAMKHFSHIGEDSRTQSNINEGIENTIIVSKNVWKYQADIEKDLDKNLPMVECFPGDLNQVFINLIVNATNAIEEKIENSAVKRGLIKIKTSANKEKTKVIISFNDNGNGIPDHVKDKIFNPFFTTKEVGKGTGQGLSLAYKTIVEKHNGKIYFESIRNIGTTFFIELPVSFQENPK